MAKKILTQSTVATNNIQSLPVQVKGQAATVQLAFDQTGIDAKTYNNSTLLPELQSETANDSGANSIGAEGTFGTNNVGDELKAIKVITDDTYSKSELLSKAELQSQTDGSSGMDVVGMTPINGVMTTPQQSLEYLKERVDATNPTTNIYSVLDNGLTGDGVTNDATKLNELITLIGSKESTIVFPALKTGQAVYLIQTNVAFPENVNLVFLNGGTLKVDNTYTVTCTNTKLEAGLYHIFDLSLGGVIAGSWVSRYSFPQWFGAVADGASDNSLALALCSYHNKTFLFTEGQYNYASNVLIQNTNNLSWITEGEVILYDEGKDILLNDEVTLGSSAVGIQFINCDFLNIGNFTHDGFINSNHGIVSTSVDDQRRAQFEFNNCDNLAIGTITTRSLVGVVVDLTTSGIDKYLTGFYFKIIDCNNLIFSELIMESGCGKGEIVGFYNCDYGEFKKSRHFQGLSSVTFASLIKAIGCDKFKVSDVAGQSESIYALIDVCGFDIVLENFDFDYKGGHMFDITSEWGAYNFDSDNITIKDCSTNGDGFTTSFSSAVANINNITVDNFTSRNEDSILNGYAFANPYTKLMRCNNNYIKDIRNLLYARLDSNTLLDKRFIFNELECLTTQALSSSGVTLDVVGVVEVNDSYFDFSNFNDLFIRDESLDAQSIVDISSSISMCVFNDCEFRNMTLNIGAHTTFNNCDFFNCAFDTRSSSDPLANPRVVFKNSKIEVTTVASQTADGLLFNFLSGAKLDLIDTELTGTTVSALNPMLYRIQTNNIPCLIDGCVFDILRSGGVNLKLFTHDNNTDEYSATIKNTTITDNMLLLSTSGTDEITPSTFSTITVINCELQQVGSLVAGIFNNRLNLRIVGSAFVASDLNNIVGKSASFHDFTENGNVEW